MTKKITIDKKGGSVTLPSEALEVFGDAEELFLHIDEKNSAIILSVTDPIITSNKNILDEMAEISNELTDEDYYEPVPDSFLEKNKSDSDNKDGD